MSRPGKLASSPIASGANRTVLIVEKSEWNKKEGREEGSALLLPSIIGRRVGLYILTGIV